MKKLLIYIFLLCSLSAFAQNNIKKTAGINYTQGAPTFTPDERTASEIAIDTVTGFVYQWHRTVGPSNFGGWRVLGQGIDVRVDAVPPTYVPFRNQSVFVVNAVDSLYYYHGGSWHHLNKGGGGGSTYTAGTGIAINGSNVISNTGDLSTTNELNTSMSVTGGNLRLTDAGGNKDVAVTDIAPIQALTAGSGISISGAGSNKTVAANDQRLTRIKYQSSYWTSTSEFTFTGTTPTVTNGTLQYTGGDGSINNYGVLNASIQTTQKIEISMTYTITGSTSVNGLGIGRRSVNTWYNPGVNAIFIPTNNSITIWQTNTSTKLAEKFLSYSVAANDVLRETYIEENGVITFVFENLTQNKIDAISVKNNYSTATSLLPPNTAKAAIYHYSGAFNVLSFSVKCSDKAPYIAFIGDSKSTGLNATAETNAFSSLCASLGSVGIFSGNGDRTVEIVQSISDIASTNPKYAILNLGRNDIISSVSSATWQANYRAIVDTLEAHSVTVYHLLPIPENIENATAVRSFILSTYPGKTIDTTGFVRSTMLSSDNIHPNAFGHRQIAKNILASGLIPAQSEKTAELTNLGRFYGLTVQSVFGSGTSTYIPKFTGGTYIGNSAVSDNGTSITSTEPLTINSSTTDQIVLTGASSPVIRFRNAGGSDMAILQASSGFCRFYVYGNVPLQLASNNKTIFRGESTTVEIGNTAGFGYSAILLRGFDDLSTGYSLICSPSTVSTSTAPLTVKNNGLVGIGTNAQTEKLTVNGNIKLPTAGNKIFVATGTNASAGTATLVGGTVTVNTTAVTSNSIIIVKTRNVIVAQGALSTPSANIVNGVSFKINSSNVADASEIDWWIIN